MLEFTLCANFSLNFPYPIPFPQISSFFFRWRKIPRAAGGNFPNEVHKRKIHSRLALLIRTLFPQFSINFDITMKLSLIVDSTLQPEVMRVIGLDINKFNVKRMGKSFDSSNSSTSFCIFRRYDITARYCRTRPAAEMIWAFIIHHIIISLNYGSSNWRAYIIFERMTESYAQNQCSQSL